MPDNKRYARTNHCEGDAMAEPHEWRPFDLEAGLDVRQITAEGEPDRYEIRDSAGKVTELDADEFAQLRDVSPNPKSL